MKVELEIITDRLPTEADGKSVLRWDGNAWIYGWAESVEKGVAWIRQPPPPKPPIDTSLAASIRRDKERSPSVANHNEPCTCVCCDRNRVWEAARKWDTIGENLQILMNSKYPDSNNSDPDGVELVHSFHCSGYRGVGNTFDMEHCDCNPKRRYNDPDGVGEGWRKLKKFEKPEPGDECKDMKARCKCGWQTSYAAYLNQNQNERYIYRRRIEAEK